MSGRDRLVLACNRCPGAEHAAHGWVGRSGDLYDCPGVETKLLEELPPSGHRYMDEGLS